MNAQRTAIDVLSGRLTFDVPSTVIDGNLTSDGLSASPLWARCQQMIRNPPWDLKGYLGAELAGERFGGMICFSHDRLKFLTLVTQRPEFGTSWETFSSEKENARQRFHYAWLRDQLGAIEPRYMPMPPYPSWEWSFEWGRIISGWDTKNGTTEITVGYGNQ